MENNTLPPISSRILYQSSACVVVNKLAGEAVEGASGGMIDLPKELKSVLNENIELIEAVHRLDVPVTGCALFALTKTALSFLNSAFAGEAALPSPVEKTYWAVIEKPSRPLPESGELVHWIENVSGKNKSTAHKKDGANRKKAVLRYRITGEEKIIFLSKYNCFQADIIRYARNLPPRGFT